MPAVSKKQFAAMEAAKHGNSTLGIPQAVGAEYADATPNPKALPPKVKKKGPMAKAMAKHRGEEC